MLNPEVNPQVIFGSPSTGAGSDSFRRALGKFNVHTHSQVQHKSFFIYDLKTNDLLERSPVQEENYFAQDTTVVSHTIDQLVLSAPAIRSTSNGTLVIAGKTISGVVTVVGSPVVTKAEIIGLAHPAQTHSASVRVFTGTVTASLPSTQFLLLDSLFDYKILRFSYQLKQGSAQIRLIRDTQIIKILPQPTTSPQTVTFDISQTSNPKVFKGESLGVSFTSIAQRTDIFYTLYTSDITG